MRFYTEKNKLYHEIDRVCKEVEEGKDVLFTKLVYQLTRKFTICSELAIKKRVLLNVELRNITFDGEWVRKK